MQEHITKLNVKGQVVIPKELREKHALTAGKTLVIFEDVDGTIKIIPKTKLSDIQINVEVDLKEAEREVEELRKE